ncbi:MAG TPA: hypothetical protein VGK73_26910 [Polyangiaceae bacterium]
MGTRGLARSALAWGIGAALSGASVARAAEVRWQGPAECDGARDAVERVEELVGRKLDSVEGLDFEVATKRLADGSWELELMTHDAGAAPGERRFVAKTCAAVTDAAAVAMAMTIRGSSHPPEEQPAESAPAPPAEDPRATPAPPVRDSVRPKPGSAPPKNAALVGAGLVLDTATLPSAAAGLTASAVFRHSSLRLEIQGTFLPRAMADIGEGREGRFSFLSGAPLVCLDRGLRGFSALACGGYEIGQLTGEGQGVSDPARGSILWQAVRLDLGAGLAATDWLRVVARLGAAIPTTRSEFVLAGVPVHETPALSARAAIAVDIVL